MKKQQQSQASTPNPKLPVPKALVAAGFTFSTSEQAGKAVAHGYIHKDGRAALYIENGKESAWQIRMPDGTEKGGQDAKTLATALKEVPKLKTAEPKAPELPGNVKRAVEILAGLTLQKFDLQLLRGEKHLQHRITLLSRLFDHKEVKAKDAGINALVEAFYSAVGVGEGSAATKAAEFTKRCKAIVVAVRREKAADRKQAKEEIAENLRRTALERTVPGEVLPTHKPQTKKQRLAEQAAAAREMYVLAVTAEPVAAPKPDAEVKVIAADVRLLEDPKNGIAMLQLEKSNSQGAICVYNNGSRVAAGVVPPETLKTLRPVPNADLLKAANQLLNPIVPSVPVTPVAARHLTAVIHCKELVMTESNAIETTKKFAAPATKKAAKKAAKPAKKAAKPAKKAAAKKEAAGASRGAEAVVKLKKQPQEGDLPKQAFIIAKIIKSKGGQTTVGKLLEAMEKEIESSQTMQALWSFYRSKLIAKGFVTITA